MKNNVRTKSHTTDLTGHLQKIFKRLVVKAVIFGSFIILAGCASVKFYSDPGLKNETGLKYYTLKPYLLVEYMAGKDNTVKTSVIYLPDLADPQYMGFKTGIGKNEIELGFTNSALASSVARSGLATIQEAGDCCKRTLRSWICRFATSFWADRYT